MVKNRNISVHSDLKTGLFCKLSLILGIILLAIYIIQFSIPNLSIEENTSGIIISFSIIFIGLGIILYFFQCQFAKLSKIAEEIEKECDFTKIEEK